MKSNAFRAHRVNAIKFADNLGITNPCVTNSKIAPQHLNDDELKQRIDWATHAYCTCPASNEDWCTHYFRLTQDAVFEFEKRKKE